MKFGFQGFKEAVADLNVSGQFLYHQGEQIMNNVKVDKLQLLETVKKNMKEHRKIFLEAQKNYRAQAIKELDAMLAEAKAGKRIRRSVTLIEPVDQTKEYNRAIKMLEMSTDTIIELTSQQFAQLVMDEWHWKGQFLASNMHYSDSATKAFLAGDYGG